MSNPITSGDLYQDKGHLTALHNDLIDIDKGMQSIVDKGKEFKDFVSKLKVNKVGDKAEIQGVAIAVDKLARAHEALTQARIKTEQEALKVGVIEAQVKTAMSKTTAEEQKALMATEKLNKARSETILVALKVQIAQDKLTAATNKTAAAANKVPVKKLTQEEKLLEKQTNSLAGSYDHLSASLGLNLIKLHAMSKADRENTQAGKDLTKTVRQQREELKRLDAQTGNFSRNVGNYSGALAKFGKSLLGAFGLGSAVFTGVSIFKNAIKNVADFQLELAKLSSLTGVVGKDLEDIGHKAIEFSTEFGVSAIELLRIFTLVGSKLPQLLSQPQELARVARDAEILAKASGDTVEDAVQGLSLALAQFQIPIEKSRDVIDILATAAQKGAAEIPQLSEALHNVGNVAHVSGLSLETTVAALEAMAKGGVIGSEAGIKFRNILLSLAATGRDELNPAIRPLPEILQRLNDELKLSIDPVHAASQATDLFDKRNVGAALALIGQRDELQRLDGTLLEHGNALSQAITNTDNLAGAWDKLGASLISAQNTLFSFGKQSDTLLDGLTKFFSSIGESNLLGILGFETAAAAQRRLQKEFEKNKEAEELEAGRLQNLINLNNKFFNGDTGGKGLDTNILNVNEVARRAGLARALEEEQNASELDKLSLKELRAERKKLTEQTPVDATAALNIANRFQAITERIKELTGAGKAVEIFASGSIGSLDKKITDLNKKLAHSTTDEARTIFANSIRELELQKQGILNAVDSVENQLKIRELKNAVLPEFTNEEKQAKELDQLAIHFERQKELYTSYGLDIVALTEDYESDREAIENKYAELDNKNIQYQADQRKSFYKQLVDSLVGFQKARAADAAKNKKEITDKLDFEFSESQAHEKNLFDLKKHSTLEAKRFELKLIIDKYEYELKMQSIYGGRLTDLQISQFKEYLAALKIEGNKLASTRETPSDIFDLLGFDFESEDNKAAFVNGIGFIGEQVRSLIDLQDEVTQAALENADIRIEAAQKELDAQIENKNRGYAYSITNAARELALAKKAKQDALKQQQKDQRAELALNSLGEGSNLALGISKAFALGPILGPILAGAMLVAFAAAKIKAFSLINKKQFRKGHMDIIGGGTHESGNDTYIGQSGGSPAFAEVGETRMILPAKATRKYKSTLPAVFNALRNGTFEKIFSRNKYASEGIPMLHNEVNLDTRRMEDKLDTIIKQGGVQRFYDPDGNLVVIKGLHKTTYRKKSA